MYIFGGQSGGIGSKATGRTVCGIPQRKFLNNRFFMSHDVPLSNNFPDQPLTERRDLAIPEVGYIFVDDDIETSERMVSSLTGLTELRNNLGTAPSVQDAIVLAERIATIGASGSGAPLDLVVLDREFFDQQEKTKEAAEKFIIAFEALQKKLNTIGNHNLDGTRIVLHSSDIDSPEKFKPYQELSSHVVGFVEKAGSTRAFFSALKPILEETGLIKEYD